MPDVNALNKAYNDKLKELLLYMKNPVMDGQLFQKNPDFRDKGAKMSNCGGTKSSSVDKIWNLPATSLVIKRGVKLKIQGSMEKKIEPCTSNSDVIGFCYNWDDYYATGQVKPIQSVIQDWFVCKKNAQIAVGDKLKFVADGELDKETAQGTLNAIALSASVKFNDEITLVHAIIWGFKAKP